MSGPLTITLPLPPKECNPNGRHHWRAAMKPKADYRARSAAESIAARNRRACNWPVASIVIDYYHRTANWKDPDNILASMKAAIDGLADGGILANDRDVTYRVQRFTDKAAPRVVLTVREGESC